MMDILNAEEAVDPEVIGPYLERIFASPEFVRSERMISFLRFVVERTIADQKQSINERTIGHSVFKKPADWNPSIDTIVRSESRRLRAKLDQYYEGLGRHDRLRIRIPKGTYVPEFVPHVPEAPPQPIRPAAEPSTTVHPSPGVASPEKPVRRRPVLLGVVGSLLVLCVGLIALHLERSKTESEGGRNDFSTIPFTADFGKEFSPAISPDGKTVAYVWDDGSGTPDIYLRDVNARTSRRLLAAPDVRLYPSWSHDGSKIAFLAVRGDRLAVVISAVRDRSETTIATVEKSVGRWTEDSSPLLGCPGPVFSPDDRSLVLEDHRARSAVGGLVQLGLDGTKQAQITETTGEVHDLYPRFSPDGRSIAFVRYSSHGVGDIFVQSVHDPGSVRQLTHDHRTIQGVAWTRGGKQLIFSSNRRGNFQLWSISVRDQKILPVPTGVNWASEPSIASQGDWLIYVQASNNWNIWRRPLMSAGPSERFIASSGRNYDARYSPDGHHIAFASDRSGYMELWVSDADGQNAVQLTHLLANWLGGISWSPDGKFLAFDARPQGHSTIYVIAAAGGDPKPLNSGAFEERMPAWSPEGRSIYFNSNREGTTAIFARSLENGFTQLISPPGMFAAAVSGNELFISSQSGELYRSDPDGAHFEALPQHLKAAPVMSWMPIGGSLYVSRFDPLTRSFNLYRYQKGQINSLGPLEGALVPNAPDIAISSDQKWVLYARQETAQSDLTIRRASE